MNNIKTKKNKDTATLLDIIVLIWLLVVLIVCFAISMHFSLYAMG